MSKNEVSRQLEQIAAFLEFKGENAFRVRAYQTAARAVAGFPEDLAQAAASGELAELKGIGSATLKIVVEVLATGRCQMLEDLRREIPPGLVDMMRISGLGVAKIRQIHESLGIDTLSGLEAAAADGRLAQLPRFGPKAAEKVLKSLAFLKRVGERRLFHHARAEATGLLPGLRDLPGVTDVAIVGDLRRRLEVIGDLEFLLTGTGSWESVAERMDNLTDVTEFASKAEGTFTLKFASGSVAAVHVTRPGVAGFALVTTTGSAEHLAQLAERAASLGLAWTPLGIERDGAAVPVATEADVYAALGLQWIPPELREGLGEVDAAARGALPDLVAPEQIRGFLHCHSNYSDGTSTVADWARAARDAGYEYIGITDHSVAATYAGGLVPEHIEKQFAEIDDVNAELGDVHVLKGIEVDILQDGTLDYTPEIRARFDFVIASVHNGFGQDADEMTTRILRAMDDPEMVIFGHPTGRLLLSRDPYPMDLNAIFAKAGTLGIAVEINADPQRLDLDWRLAREAMERGVTISIGADAHNTSGMTNMDLGIGIARKGWLTADHILNARPLGGFLDHVARRRQR